MRKADERPQRQRGGADVRVRHAGGVHRGAARRCCAASHTRDLLAAILSAQAGGDGHARQRRWL